MERRRDAEAPLTVAELHNSSRALLRLHKALLAGERLAYVGDTDRPPLMDSFFSSCWAIPTLSGALLSREWRK